MSRVLVRNLDAGELWEIFLVSAITAVLGIRLFLILTGYPQLGGESLHIAHMLWGGLLMLAALVLLLGFLGRGVRVLAAALGGLGFGAFIDELGKFITADNDYFYQPAIALIYVTFVLLWLLFRTLRPRELTETERVANALEMLHEAVRLDLDVHERRRALQLLEEADPDDDVATALRAAVEGMVPPPARRPGLVRRLRDALRTVYRALIAWRWFARATVVLAVVFAISTVIGTISVIPGQPELVVLAAIAVALSAALIRAVQQAEHSKALGLGVALAAALGAVVLRFAMLGEPPALGFFGWGHVVSSIVPAVWLLFGVHHLRYSRLEAYRTFEQAILFEIFVTEVFAFYSTQLEAVLALFADILILGGLRTMIAQEEELRRERAA